MQNNTVTQELETILHEVSGEYQKNNPGKVLLFSNLIGQSYCVSDISQEVAGLYEGNIEKRYEVYLHDKKGNTKVAELVVKKPGVNTSLQFSYQSTEHSQKIEFEMEIGPLGTVQDYKLWAHHSHPSGLRDNLSRETVTKALIDYINNHQPR
jgi:hypothetical protein